MALKRVLVLVGPTASGKSEVAIHLAQLLDGEILSADSRQVYKYLDIGTAKLTPVQRRRIPHHFIDLITPDRDYSAGEFGTEGRKVIDGIFLRNRLPIIAGGSGLYVQSLIDGLFEGPGADEAYRAELERRIAAGGIGRLIELLREVDPVAGLRADPTKPRRIIRALEVYHRTGKPLSEHQREHGVRPGFEAAMFGLTWERAALYIRIDQRCVRMLENGLLKEVDELERMGYPSTLNSLNTVGYKEAFAYRRGEIGFAELLRLFQQNSRRYAKRQLTWFRRDGRIRWIRCDETRDARAIAAEIADAFGRAVD
jgi:tRNA dimethylallyltransferase